MLEFAKEEKVFYYRELDFSRHLNFAYFHFAF